MGLWKKASDYLTSEIEIILEHGSGAYAALREEMLLGGSITRVTDERQTRCIFHDNFFLNMSYVLLYAEADRSVVTVYRNGAGSVTIFTSQDGSDDTKTREHRFRLRMGEARTISDTFGRLITVRRIRHRDFVLLPR